MRTAPMGAAAKENQCDQEGTVSTPRRCLAQDVVFTAVPAGTLWQVKAIAPSGEVMRLGLFAHRADALWAACLMAEIAGARFLP